MTISKLESELELCPFMESCCPEENEIEDFCVINYENCEKYIRYLKENTDVRRLK